MKLNYYPGCSLEGISAEYDESIRSLFERLDITLEELPDWICCGTLAAPSISPLLGLATPLWNVAQAQKSGGERLLTPCSACLYHFKNAAHQVERNATLRQHVENVLDTSLTNLPVVIHPLELLSDVGFEAHIKASIARDLSGLKVVCYYGCHITRPARIMQFDDPEHPQSMDRLLRLAGADVLDWDEKVTCCGAHFSLVKPELVFKMCGTLFEAALDAGADAIVVGCPMCHANLDTRQGEIAASLGIPLNMPILYFSQLLGYAMGMTPKELGLKRHIVDPMPLMVSKCTQRSAQEVRV